MPKAKLKRKVYRPMKFGAGPRPRTVEAELSRRMRRKQERDAEDAWRRRLPEGEGTRDWQRNPGFYDEYWGPGHSMMRTSAGLLRLTGSLIWKVAGLLFRR